MMMNFGVNWEWKGTYPCKKFFGFVELNVLFC